MTGIIIYVSIALIWEASAWLRGRKMHRERMKRIALLMDASAETMKNASEFLAAMKQEESVNPVTPPSQNEEHDSTATTG